MVNCKVILDENATIIWEYNDAIIEKKGNPGEPNGMGYTDDKNNTQVNKTQVNVPNVLEFDENGIPIVNESNNATASKTGSHEDGHVGRLRHGKGLMGNKDNNTELTKEQ